MPFSSLPDKSKGRTLYGTGEHGLFSVNYEHGMSTEEMVKREPEYLPQYKEDFNPEGEVRIAVSSNRPAP